jgi:hypothetical protein
MASVAVGEVVQVVLKQSMFNNVLMNVFHYQCDIAATIGTYEDCMQGILNSMYQAVPAAIGLKMLAMQSNQLLHTEARAQVIAPTRRVAVIQTPNLPGTQNGSCDAGNVALSITKRTALAGRKYIGKCQVGGIQKAWFVNGEFHGAAITAADDVAAAILAGVTAGVTLGHFIPVLFHKATPAQPTPITSTQVQHSLRTMHRRTLSLGI